MKRDTLTRPLREVIEALTPEEQAAVREFVEFLKNKKPAPFLAAIDEFMDQHPDLLRRLAK